MPRMERQNASPSKLRKTSTRRPTLMTPWASVQALLRVMPGAHAPPALVGPTTEDDPAKPRAHDVGHRAQDHARPRPLAAPALALHERHRELLDAGALPPDAQQAFRIGEGALRLEGHRLDQGRGIHGHVLIVVDG